MKKSLLLAVSFAALASSASVFASEAVGVEAPLGFQWGETQAQVEKSGIELTCKKDGMFDSCYAAKAPRLFPNAAHYQLVFSPDTGLQKLIIHGESLNRDSEGKAGQHQFNRLLKIVSQKHGEPEILFRDEVQTFGTSVDFYECLSTGCAHWSSLWTSDDGNGAIALFLRGEGRGQGFINIGFESPIWGNELKKNKIEMERMISQVL